MGTDALGEWLSAASVLLDNRDAAESAITQMRFPQHENAEGTLVDNDDVDNELDGTVSPDDYETDASYKLGPMTSEQKEQLATRKAKALQEGSAVCLVAFVHPHERFNEAAQQERLTTHRVRLQGESPEVMRKIDQLCQTRPLTEWVGDEQTKIHSSSGGLTRSAAELSGGLLQNDPVLSVDSSSNSADSRVPCFGWDYTGKNSSGNNVKTTIEVTQDGTRITCYGANREKPERIHLVIEGDRIVQIRECYELTSGTTQFERVLNADTMTVSINAYEVLENGKRNYRNDQDYRVFDVAQISAEDIQAILQRAIAQALPEAMNKK